MLERALAQAPLFAGISKRHLRTVARLARVSSFHAGASVVTEGAEGSAMYVLLEGTAKVVKGGRTLARLGPGSFFGEISLLDGGPRTASVIAETPLRTVKLGGAELRKVLQQEPQMALRVLTELAKRLRPQEKPLVG